MFVRRNIERSSPNSLPVNIDGGDFGCFIEPLSGWMNGVIPVERERRRRSQNDLYLCKLHLISAFCCAIQFRPPTLSTLDVCRNTSDVTPAHRKITAMQKVWLLLRCPKRNLHCNHKYVLIL